MEGEYQSTVFADRQDARFQESDQQWLDGYWWNRNHGLKTGQIVVELLRLAADMIKSRFTASFLAS
jgi:hypothetical protein